MGMERVLLAMQARGVAATAELDVFVVHAGEGAELRGAGSWPRSCATAAGTWCWAPAAASSRR